MRSIVRRNGGNPNSLVDGNVGAAASQRIILDADLAARYDVPTKRLNQQVKRNAVRFPKDFVFRPSPSLSTAPILHGQPSFQ